MRVLHLIGSLDPASGGPAEGLRQSCAAARRLGIDFEVATLDRPEASFLDSFPANTYALGPVATKFGYSPRLIPWLRLYAPNYDAVVVHGLWQFHGFAARLALGRRGPPYFVFTHGMLDPWFKQTYPLKHAKKWLYWLFSEFHLLKGARAVLFTTQEESRLAAQSFWLYRVRSSVVGFGMDDPRNVHAGQINQFLEAFPECRDRRLILFLARIHPKKGADLLIDAFAGVTAKEPALHLVMAGPDDNGLRAKLQAQALRLGIAKRITWTGLIQDDIKWGAIQAAEAFALTSHQENFGLALVEAMAAGLPVLTTRKVNIWNEIQADGAGMVEEDTPEGAQRLLARWLATSLEQRRAMSVCARQCFRTHFHIDATTNRLIGTIRPSAQVHEPILS